LRNECDGHQHKNNQLAIEKPTETPVKIDKKCETNHLQLCVTSTTKKELFEVSGLSSEQQT
jgi:hypothetical protein